MPATVQVFSELTEARIIFILCLLLFKRFYLFTRERERKRENKQVRGRGRGRSGIPIEWGAQPGVPSQGLEITPAPAKIPEVGAVSDCDSKCCALRQQATLVMKTIITYRSFREGRMKKKLCFLHLSGFFFFFLLF